MKHCKRAKHENNLYNLGINYKIGKICLTRQFSNDFVSNCKEFVEEGTRCRFGAIHPQYV